MPVMDATSMITTQNTAEFSIQIHLLQMLLAAPVQVKVLQIQLVKIRTVPISLILGEIVAHGTQTIQELVEPTMIQTLLLQTYAVAVVEETSLKITTHVMTTTHRQILTDSLVMHTLYTLNIVENTMMPIFRLMNNAVLAKRTTIEFLILKHCLKANWEADQL